ncbi:hypothetical protein NKG94_39955 [Micromonospora sp. M12]
MFETSRNNAKLVDASAAPPRIRSAPRSPWRSTERCPTTPTSPRSWTRSSSG